MKAFNRLRIRLTFVCALSTGVVLICMAAVSYGFSLRQMQLQYQESFAASCANIYVHIREQPVITHSWLMQTEQDNQVWISIDRDESTMFYGQQIPARKELFDAARKASKENYDFRGAASFYNASISSSIFEWDSECGTYRVATSYLPTGGKRLMIMILKDMQPEQKQIFHLQLCFVTSACVATICLFLFAWSFSHWATKPVEESHRRQMEFVGAASHEFRSPVAVIQLGAENIKAMPEASGHIANIILRECSRLKRLTEDMLQLAAADTSSFSLRMLEANPETILLSIQEKFETIATEKNIHFSLQLPDISLNPLNCDQDRIEQLLGNLVDNALQHTPEGGEIQLGAVSEQSCVIFFVADSGSGVPDSVKDRIFDRFFQIDTSRTGKEHYGLGLSVASEIAAMHKGKLWVENSSLGGSIFFLQLPID